MNIEDATKLCKSKHKDERKKIIYSKSNINSVENDHPNFNLFYPWLIWPDPSSVFFS